VVSYEPLFKTLKDRKISFYRIRKDTGISKRITYHINKGKNISFDTLETICKYLRVPVEEVIYIDYENSDN
jgi:putative transcriptional regulator